MAEAHGLVIKVWKVDVASQELLLSDLEKLLSDNTRLGERILFLYLFCFSIK